MDLGPVGPGRGPWGGAQGGFGGRSTCSEKEARVGEDLGIMGVWGGEGV